MKSALKIVFLFALALFFSGPPGIGYAGIMIGDHDDSCCYLPTPPRKIHISVPDLVPIAGSPDRNATYIPRLLKSNLALIGSFDIREPRASLEENLEAGVVAGSEPDYQAWIKIGADFLIKGGFESTGSKLTLELRLFDVALGKQILGKRYSSGPKGARKMVNQFTNEALGKITGTPGVFGSEIIFASGSPSQKQIMKTTLGSDGAVHIAGHKKGSSTQPIIGPGGSMAWVRRNDKIWELVCDGQTISSGDLHLSPTFKPDGSLVAARYGPQKTAIYDFSAKPPKPMASPGGINVSPTFSPDGRLIVFESTRNKQRQLFIMSANGDNQRPLMPEYRPPQEQPYWSPVWPEAFTDKK